MSEAGAILATVPTADPISSAGNAQLVIACLVGIAVIVVLISWLKMHPFLALIIGSAALAAVAWIAPTAALTSFTNGVGSTAGGGGGPLPPRAQARQPPGPPGGGGHNIQPGTPPPPGSKA